VATRLYLRNILAAGAPTAGEKSTALPVGTAGLQSGANTQDRSLLLTKGTTQTSIAFTGLGQTTHQDNYLARFTSLPLSAQTVTAQTWTFALALNEANAAANSQLAPCIYLWRPGSSSVVGFVVDSDTPIGAEWGASEDGIVATVSGAAVTAVFGDVLVLEVWRHAPSQTNTTARVQTVYFDGPTDVVDATTANAASYIETPQNLVFPQTYAETGRAVSAVATPATTVLVTRVEMRSVAIAASPARTDALSNPLRAQVSWVELQVPSAGTDYDELARGVPITSTAASAPTGPGGLG
jgi:hypothetical protein